MAIDQGDGPKPSPLDVNIQKQNTPNAPEVFKERAKAEKRKIELQTVGDIEKMLVQQQKRVNYAEVLGNNRMIFIGESHLNNEEQEHIVRHAKDLKAAGITHYAVETIIP